MMNVNVIFIGCGAALIGAAILLNAYRRSTIDTADCVFGTGLIAIGLGAWW